MEIDIAQQLTTLGHPQRLSIFRLLMRRYPDRVPAGEIGDALELKPSTLSTYLASLHACGLVSQRRAGTSLRYTVAIDRARAMIDFLALDCCRGRPDICINFGSEHTEQKDKFNVLFLCTRNSARSIFAEAILTKLAADRFNVYSAGTQPSGDLPRESIQTLVHNGHSVASHRSKSLAEFQTNDAPVMDFVFTVCDKAANEECPVWEGQPISAHWGIPDPVHTDGTDAEKTLAFQTAYNRILNRLRAFTQLPLTSLDRISLQNAVDRIADISTDKDE
ncbi:helix-turn-helix domain-containing protein [Halocynthiibacter sp. C4]|uniref:arsenate reductase/protein-tyrosine-phosphatase family protein n=1 Tax=Halocynthiibacter sp. C4 TaxID=2992758 RepID=UPI00237A20E7|nr:ArsR family transcriptional regulator [Halocynthiibacter sp. C4]MDE0589453.1 helix-turn-helix domain-containing protein [Halocynthiibacter sp. C4]